MRLYCSGVANEDGEFVAGEFDQVHQYTAKTQAEAVGKVVLATLRSGDKAATVSLAIFRDVAMTIKKKAKS